jgi:hypothetical protein
MTVDKKWRWLGNAVLALWVILSGVIFYVNHFMPHGLMRDTGDVVCENDDQSLCGEDISRLHIPGWAKVMRSNGVLIAWIGLGTAWLIITARPEGGYKK